MIAVQVAVVGLAAWRVASLLTHEMGPFDVFERLRTWVGVRPAPEYQRTQLAKLFSCMWCATPWVAVIMWALWWLHPLIPGVLAAAAVAILAERAAPR